ncbi:hypothetical protein DFJ73DRAFT_850282 [Zopfochytrium polystomum]|nr:hypothetical protein DFJ73DRAFT_850282 [Zopfochytrium polystomum]
MVVFFFFFFLSFLFSRSCLSAVLMLPSFSRCRSAPSLCSFLCSLSLCLGLSACVSIRCLYAWSLRAYATRERKKMKRAYARAAS